jgi:hypothetical protein
LFVVVGVYVDDLGNVAELAGDGFEPAGVAGGEGQRNAELGARGECGEDEGLGVDGVQAEESERRKSNVSSLPAKRLAQRWTDRFISFRGSNFHNCDGNDCFGR